MNQIDSLVTAARRPKRRKSPRPGPKSATFPELVPHVEPAVAAIVQPTVYGPYADGGKWRLVVTDRDQRRAIKTDSYESAIALRDSLLDQIKRRSSRTFREAVADYRQNLASRGVLTVGDTIGKLLRFLPLDEVLSAIDNRRAESMYLAETQRRKEDGQLIAVDSHHSMLRTTKTFYKWLVATRQIKVSPFAEVRYVGRPKRGKTQLRIDEARKLVAVALEHASNRKVAPAAILMQIFLGLRPTESVVRAVRDLDDEGRMLWVPFGKTSNAKRRLQVPETLRQVLLLHAEGKSADDPLLGPLHEPEHNRDLIYYNLRKLCQEAGVPCVCPHSLRGLNATLALEAGATPHSVAAALGHSSFATTARHYADSNAVANLSLRKVADLLGAGHQHSDLEQLARLLHENLSQSDLCALRERLSV